ncbi:MAG: gliding motility-associated C-terminal domain-containing protein [Bacteroidota bacterium]
MKSLILLFCCFCLVGLLPKASLAQNLLPDGSFELLDTDRCFDPDEGFVHSPHWYSLDASPDLFVNDCFIDENGLIFWDNSSAAFAGNNYAGLASRFNSNQSYVSEGIATRLDAPLLADAFYYFELHVRSKGSYQGWPDSLITCPLRPEKHFELYASTDSIIITNDISNGTSTTSAVLMAKVDDPVFEQATPGGWTKIATCFKANGGEKHIAISHPLGNFGELPACIEDLTAGTFHSYYFDIDQAVLRPFPRFLTKEMTLCEGRPFELDLYEVLEELPLLETATFQWTDGSTQAKRLISEAGTYQVTVNLACGNTTVAFSVEGIDCELQLYIPNAFSPNGDGRNDQFRPFFNAGTIVRQYQLSIFDRWGKTVFQSTNPDQGWDGQSGQLAAANGSYIWMLRCELLLPYGMENYESSGSILLIR